MYESPEVQVNSDRLREVAALRKRGYLPEEIQALLSNEKWLGNVHGDSGEENLHLSGLWKKD